MPTWLWCYLDFLLCASLPDGCLSPLRLVVRLPWSLWPCLPFGQLGVPPAQVALACQSRGELIPPRSYLCLARGSGPHTRLGWLLSSDVRVLESVGHNHVTHRLVREGNGLVPSCFTYLLSGLHHFVAVCGVKALQGPSLLRQGVALVGRTPFSAPLLDRARPSRPFRGAKAKRLLCGRSQKYQIPAGTGSIIIIRKGLGSLRNVRPR